MSELEVDAVTRRYAEALFELAHERGALDEVEKDVGRVTAELDSPSVATYLFDSRVPIAERRAKLQPVVTGMHQLTANFIGLLFDKRREKVLRGLATAFHRRRLVLDGAVEGVVESPTPLGADEISRLESVLSKKLGKEVRLENRTNDELIAGVRVFAAGRMIDYSARGRLDGLRRAMMSAPLPSAPGA